MVRSARGKYQRKKQLNENVYSRLDAQDKQEYAASFVRNNLNSNMYGSRRQDKGIAGKKPGAKSKENFKDALIKIWNDRNSNNDGTKLNR